MSQDKGTDLPTEDSKPIDGHLEAPKSAPPTTKDIEAILEKFRKQCINKYGGTGFEQTVYELTTLITKAETAARREELAAVNKVNNSIYSHDPAAYYVNIQRHVNSRLAALEPEDRKKRDIHEDFWPERPAS